MADNKKLHQAKKAKNDEFYTQYADIEKEMNAYIEFNENVFRDKTLLLPCDDPEWSNFTKYFAQNFENFGLKKLISTSYAADSKPREIPYQPTLFETDSPKFDKNKTASHGKIFILERDTNKDAKINVEDIEWDYLDGDGDFRSAEVTALRDEADVIITNPPFSQFIDFFLWLIEGRKSFSIIANKNCITYKEVFPFIKDNRVWSGREDWAGGMWFTTHSDAADYDEIINGVKYKNVPSIWITNIDHGRRHEPLRLMTMEDNLKYNKRLIKELQKKYGINYYPKYDNYDAIEVPRTDAIPDDYREGIGVPISFLDKYNPDQFQILRFRKGNDNKDLNFTVDEDSGTEREREREREREERSAQNHSVLQNYHPQEEFVTALSESQSRSLTNSVQNSLRSSASTDMSKTTRDMAIDLQLAEKKCTQEFSLRGSNSYIMGVPISFLEKFCPEQFEIIGATESEGKGFSKGLWEKTSGVAQPLIRGKKVYKRIFIKRRV